MAGISLGAGRDSLSVDLEAALDSLDLTRKATMNRVVGEQVGQGGVIREIIDVDELNVVVVECSASTFRPMRPKPLRATRIAMDLISSER